MTVEQERKERRRYSVGDVVFVSRRPFGPSWHSFHHAGIVTAVDRDGDITQMAETADPAGDDQGFTWGQLSQAVRGVLVVQVRLIQGALLERQFPTADRMVFGDSPSSGWQNRVEHYFPDNERAVGRPSLSSPDAIPGSSWRYDVFYRNCQHFALRMQRGLDFNHDCVETLTFQAALREGLEHSYYAAARFSSYFQPVNLFPNNCVGRIANLGLTAIWWMFLLILLIAIIVIVLVVSTMFSFQRRQNPPASNQ